MRLLIATGAAVLTLASAIPASAQTPNVQQLLQGLTTGNQSQDQALRDAFERGYQKGRQDEAQNGRSGRTGGNNRNSRQGLPDDSRNYDNGSSGDRNQSPYDRNQPSNRGQGYNNDNR